MWQLSKRIKGTTENNATKVKISGRQSIDDTDRAESQTYSKNHTKYHPNSRIQTTP